MWIVMIHFQVKLLSLTALWFYRSVQAMRYNSTGLPDQEYKPPKKWHDTHTISDEIEKPYSLIQIRIFWGLEKEVHFARIGFIIGRLGDNWNDFQELIVGYKIRINVDVVYM